MKITTLLATTALLFSTSLMAQSTDKNNAILSTETIQFGNDKSNTETLTLRAKDLENRYILETTVLFKTNLNNNGEPTFNKYTTTILPNTSSSFLTQLEHPIITESSTIDDKETVKLGSIKDSIKMMFAINTSDDKETVSYAFSLQKVDLNSLEIKKPISINTANQSSFSVLKMREPLKINEPYTLLDNKNIKASFVVIKQNNRVDSHK